MSRIVFYHHIEFHGSNYFKWNALYILYIILEPYIVYVFSLDMNVQHFLYFLIKTMEQNWVNSTVKSVLTSSSAIILF